MNRPEIYIHQDPGGAWCFGVKDADGSESGGHGQSLHDVLESVRGILTTPHPSPPPDPLADVPEPIGQYYRFAPENARTRSVLATAITLRDCAVEADDVPAAQAFHSCREAIERNTWSPANKWGYLHNCLYRIVGYPPIENLLHIRYISTYMGIPHDEATRRFGHWALSAVPFSAIAPFAPTRVQERSVKAVGHAMYRILEASKEEPHPPLGGSPAYLRAIIEAAIGGASQWVQLGFWLCDRVDYLGTNRTQCATQLISEFMGVSEREAINAYWSRVRGPVRNSTQLGCPKRGSKSRRNAEDPVVAIVVAPASYSGHTVYEVLLRHASGELVRARQFRCQGDRDIDDTVTRKRADAYAQAVLALYPEAKIV